MSTPESFKTPKGAMVLVVGERYPENLLNSLGQEGAVTEFLREMGNILFISLHNITPYETKSVRKGDMYGGLLIDHDKISFLWQFRVNGKNVFSFHGVYDVRLVPDLNLPNMDEPAHYLVMQVHMIDTKTRILKVIRGITMPPEMTVRFINAINVQLTGIGGVAGSIPFDEWNNYEPYQLATKVRMYKLGKTEL